MIMNRSFAGPEEAIDCFLRTKMDVLSSPGRFFLFASLKLSRRRAGRPD